MLLLLQLSKACPRCCQMFNHMMLDNMPLASNTSGSDFDRNTGVILPLPRTNTTFVKILSEDNASSIYTE